MIALKYAVPFCVCTCCFCSHPQLCSLLPPGCEEWQHLSENAEAQLLEQDEAIRAQNVTISRDATNVQSVVQILVQNAFSDAFSGLGWHLKAGIKPFLTPQKSKLNSEKARQELLRACEKEGSRATLDADAAAVIASGGLWDRCFENPGMNRMPQAKAMVAVNSMRLVAFQKIASMRGISYATKIRSFDNSVSTRNMAVIGSVTP